MSFFFTGERQRVTGERGDIGVKLYVLSFLFVADAVGAGAVGWGIDCDYSALRKEGRGKQSIASWPAVPLDSCPPIVVGGGARHMVGSHFFGRLASFSFLFSFRKEGGERRGEQNARRNARLVMFPLLSNGRGSLCSPEEIGPPPAAFNDQLRTGADKGNPTV